jgi:glycosyltransferase involved in cell wall biosynthesis
MSAVTSAQSTRVEQASAQPQAATLRVLAVTPGSGRGEMIFASRQMQAIAALGIEVRMFYLPSRTSMRSLLQRRRALRAEIRTFRPSLVHAQYGSVTSLFCALCSSLPLVITFRGSDLNPVPTVHPLRRFISHFFSQLSALKARRVICVSSQLRTRLCWRRDRAAVVPTGVNLSQFTPRDKIEARRLLGWDPNQPTVLFNASNKPSFKGQHLVEQAVDRASMTAGYIKLVVMSGQVDPDIVPLYFAASDCLVVASEFEGSPTVVQEALACNLPVISVEVGDVAERLQGVHPSRIVERNVDGIATAICEILTLKQRSNGRQLVGRCALEQVAKDIQAVYENAIVG